ncbi:MAG: NAAT family transporter [Acidobacteria bacterium]|nr:NAAT family transporter [Acidobacteriota bacterium]
MDTFSAALLLFLVMDPLGNIPLFMTTLKKVEVKRQRLVVVRELLIALVVLVGFLFLGQYLLRLLQLSETALTTAGGIILMIIAFKMIFPRRDASLEEDVEGEPFIVPLAIPYVAGPSAMATALLLMSREPSRWPEWLLAVLIAWFASAVIIYFSGYFARFLGEKGLVAVERLMGMLLITVAVQMLLNGIGEFIAKPN